MLGVGLSPLNIPAILRRGTATPPELVWYDGGFPAGFTPIVQMPSNTPAAAFTPATFTDAAIENQPDICRMVLAPGTYRNTGDNADFYVDLKDAIHIVGQNRAWLDGAPNPNGTFFSGFTSWQPTKIIFENLIFNDVSFMFDEPNNGPDYALYLNREVEVQVKNCVFAGQYLHDISLKRGQNVAEIIGNIFRDSERHCVEVGQEINYLEDLTQVQSTYIYGNDFRGAKNSVITVQSSKNLYVYRNHFEDVARTMRIMPLNADPNPAMTLRMLEAPMRTEIVQNTFAGDFMPLWFEGRGREEDVLYFWQNDNLALQNLSFSEMWGENADAFAAAGDPVDTLAHQKIDPGSDIQLPLPEAPPVLEDSTSGINTNVTLHEIELPIGLEEGERLFIYFTAGSSDEVTIPEGWDFVYDATNAMAGCCATRIVNGTEGTSVIFETVEPRNSSYAALRISNAQYIEANWWSGGDHPTNAENMYLAPVPGEQEYLWLTAVHWRQGSRSVTQPSSFSIVETADTGFAGAAENHTTVSSRLHRAFSQEPSDWVSTLVDTELNNHITSTIAILGTGTSDDGPTDPPPEPLDPELIVTHEGDEVTHEDEIVTHGAE